MAHRRLPSVLLLLAAVLSSACGPPATQARFDSPNSSAKIYAIQRAQRENDLSQLCNIIDQLDSDDPAVRLLAIDALQKLTGQTHGYAFDDPQPLRRAAIAQWVTACNCNQPAPLHSASSPSAAGGSQ